MYGRLILIHWTDATFRRGVRGVLLKHQSCRHVTRVDVSGFFFFEIKPNRNYFKTIYLYKTYTMDDDRRNACACAVLRARDRERRRRRALGLRDRVLVGLRVVTAAVECHIAGKTSYHFRCAAAGTICKLKSSYLFKLNIYKIR